MYRIIFYVIALIISLLIPDSRYNRYSTMYGRRRYNRIYNYFEDDTDEQSSSDGLAGIIRASMRRRKALKACKKFAQKDKYVITLRNQNILIIFDSKNKTLCCIDNKVKGRSATVVWAEQLGAAAELMFDTHDNTFERTFDEICISFSERANYSGIIEVLKNRFTVQETKPAAKVQTPKPVATEEDKPIKLTVRNNKKIDINSADEKELAKLPGISIIIAKKIIKYRTLHNGFQTVEEFYREMKIKPHFQTQLNDLICIYRAKNTKKSDDDERIIDF